MKKISLLILTFLIFIMPHTVFATVNVEERTEDDLKIWDDIEVNENNLDNILNTRFPAPFIPFPHPTNPLEKNEEPK